MYKRILIICFLALCCFFPCEGAEIPLLGNVYGRAYRSLNGKWNYIVDLQEEGYYSYRMTPTLQGFFRNAKPKSPGDLIEYDFDQSPTLNVPGDWNTQSDRLFFYEGCIWYKRDFHYTKKPGKRTILYFGAVNYETIVYVNGQKVGTHEGGFTPFNFDITDEVKEGDNFVILKVDNRRSKEHVPTLIFDWWNYGGITRDVMLLDVEDTYVENYSLQLARKDSRKIDFSLNLNRKKPGEKIVLVIPELGIRKTFRTNADGQVSVSFQAKPQLWSPDHPKRYQISIHCGADTLKDDIGFRTITTSGRQILLNGQPVFLRGVCIHEEKPDGGGRACTPEDARRLLTWAKDLGCNFVRLAHYPHNEWMLKEAERMGILVWSEIPCYWTIDWTNDATYQNAACQLRDMILRDRNRANIIIWSIANETPHSADRDRFLARLSGYARHLDSTRLISMAMEVTSASKFVNRLSDNMNQYVDVISFNEYVGWYRNVNDASRMTWEIPYDKPVIISEFGGGARQGLHGEKARRWTEEFQANLYRENLKMIDKIDGLAGTTPWVLKDFRSPRRVLPGIQDYYNRKGLMSDDGKKKLAFDVLRDWYLRKR